MFNSPLWVTLDEHIRECSWNLDQNAISSILKFIVPLSLQFALELSADNSASLVDISGAKLT